MNFCIFYCKNHDQKPYSHHIFTPGYNPWLFTFEPFRLKINSCGFFVFPVLESKAVFYSKAEGDVMSFVELSDTIISRGEVEIFFDCNPCLFSPYSILTLTLLIITLANCSRDPVWGRPCKQKPLQLL